jgi:outer membrane protein
MKNFSIALNLILLVAVGYLFYVNFSAKKPGKGAGKEEMNTATKDSVCTNNHSSIAYVELDSLNAHITSIKTKRQELENDQKNIETEWENGYRGLEAQKNEFLKRGAAISQDEAQRFQDKLMQQKDMYDSQKQQKSQTLSEKSFKYMGQIQNDLRNFLAEYNKDKKYQYILTYGSGLDYMIYKDSTLNITDDVIKGMNERDKSKAKP